MSTITTTGNQGPTNNELIPERYHSLRDAKTYAELRRILDRNGRYLSRAANIGGSQGQCNQWQLRQLRGSNNRTLVTHDDYDDGTKSTCSSSYWSEHNEQRGGGSGTAALLSAKQQQQQQQQRVRKRERQLSREQCDDTALLRYVRQQQCVTQDSSSVAGIQWHIDYLDACTQRAEEVKRRFVEKKFYNANQQGNKPRISGSVFKVQESETEVFDPEELGSFQFRKPIIRADIMDSYPSKLCHEKAEKLQNLIDNLYQLKLEAAELENEALPKIILTDCSSSPGKNCSSCARDEANTVQNNNTRSLTKDDSLKPSVRNISDNHFNISNNNGCFLQPHCNNLKVNNCLSIPTSKLYQSEARPP